MRFISPSNEKVGMHFVVGCGGFGQVAFGLNRQLPGDAFDQSDFVVGVRGLAERLDVPGARVSRTQPPQRGHLFGHVQLHVVSSRRSQKPVTRMDTEPRFAKNLKTILDELRQVFLGPEDPGQQPAGRREHADAECRFLLKMTSWKL